MWLVFLGHSASLWLQSASTLQGLGPTAPGSIARHQTAHSYEGHVRLPGKVSVHLRPLLCSHGDAAGCCSREAAGTGTGIFRPAAAMDRYDPGLVTQICHPGLSGGRRQTAPQLTPKSWLARQEGSGGEEGRQEGGEMSRFPFSLCAEGGSNIKCTPSPKAPEHRPPPAPLPLAKNAEPLAIIHIAEEN